MRPNIWIRQMKWATRYGIWLGKRREQDRILKVLQPHAEHDEMCEYSCYPEDCAAPTVQYLIHKILETDLQENVNNTGHKGA